MAIGLRKVPYRDNLRNFYEFYDEICERTEARYGACGALFEVSSRTPAYPDPELKTLTFDVGFYISRDYAKGHHSGEDGSPSEGWQPTPSDYDPGLTEQDWGTLLQDKDVF